jgi:amidase
MPAEVHYLSLAELARRLGAREISSVEATQTMIDRVARLDPVLKAYAKVTPGRALEEAERLDRESAAGKFRGPLHGVPIAVKDLCNTEGVATAAGMAIHRTHVPSTDATVVRRLKDAGAVLLGKLQMTEGAFGMHHPSIPAPLNPWNASYWTGASSSGSGSATAAGLCFGSLGSDTGGSIRFPSTMNGVTGLKPTWGRVSRAGVFALADSLDHIGPMTRDARDAAVMLSVIAGADADDPTTSPQPVADYAGNIGSGVKGRRIGMPLGLADLDADVARALEGAASVFKQAGARLIDVKRPPAFQQAALDWVPLCAVETALAHEATYPARADEYGPTLSAFIASGRRTSGVELARLQVRRAALTGQLTTLLSALDLLLMPVMGNATWTIKALEAAGRDPETVAQRLRYTAPFDMSGQPTLTLPGGMTADGMPVGFQIVGPAFSEAQILAAGHAYQQATDWHRQHPKM